MNNFTKAPYVKLALTSVTILLLLAAFTATQVAHAQNAAGAPAIRGVLEEGLIAAADITGISDTDGLTYCDRLSGYKDF